MPATSQQKKAAKNVQDRAAQDMTPTVRLVAGPGTGKSFIIEARVFHLLNSLSIDPSKIIGVSFTRAASRDLKERVYSYCQKNGQGNVTGVRISTLHSLAATILRRTGNLAAFPADPVILDEWELRGIFDKEFAYKEKSKRTRCEEIRQDHEAFWSTGVWNPPNLPVLPKPITQSERDAFKSFYEPRTQTYSCVLPGELIRMCVDRIKSNLIDPVSELGVEHLIVDEVQDLNPCDFEFIDSLITRGVNVFISGDDDQSIYSFRYAFPEGIQTFTHKYPASADHVLADCFRCTPAILNTALNVITNYPAPNRISKHLQSVYVNSNPPNSGILHAFKFGTAKKEAEYIAQSCLALINAGLPPSDIMVLLCNKKALRKTITDEFDALRLIYDANQKDEFIESNHGRFLIGLLRIISNRDDYFAHRMILGTPDGIGISTCSGITDKVISGGMNYLDLFYQTLPPAFFSSREFKAIEKARVSINQIRNWGIGDTVDVRKDVIENILLLSFDQSAVNDWKSFISSLPQEMTLSELREFMQADSEETKDNILKSVRLRMNIEGAIEPESPNEMIRIMSFHSSKGLSAKVVFIPGLEEMTFPTLKAQAKPGAILESARALYVAVTRAKAACFLSYSQKRTVFGTFTSMHPSRFCVSTQATFSFQAQSVMSVSELNFVLNCVTNL